MSNHAAPLVPPGSMLGVLGGGQLGRMFVHAAQTLGFRTAVLDPDAHSPAGLVSHLHLQADYLDAAALATLAAACAAVTTEFENVPAPALATLAASLPVAPGAQAVAICQDRAQEKAHFVACGVPCAPHALIATPAQLAEVLAQRAGELLPGILKTARLGYDGKGQVRVSTADELSAAWTRLGQVPCVLEKMLPLHSEISVIVARGRDAQVVHFPVQHNLHRDGILAVTTVPAPGLPPALQEQAVQAAQRIAASLNYVGVLCVEFFVVRGDARGDAGAAATGGDPTSLHLVANEMAPRPHNSGHYSIDACDLSQFDCQVRAMAGLPLVAPRLHSPVVMLNLLGDLWFDAAGQQRTPDWAAILALPGAHLHLYGKAEARRGRKMGHLTLTAATAPAAQALALQAAQILGLPAW